MPYIVLYDFRQPIAERDLNFLTAGGPFDTIEEANKWRKGHGFVVEVVGVPERKK